MPSFGRALRLFLESDEQMMLLEAPPFNRCGWLDGGCGMLAHALEIWAGGTGERVVLAGFSTGGVLDYQQAQHEALRWHDWYIDGDGAARKRTWLARWSRSVADPAIVSPGAVFSEIPDHPEGAQELADRLHRVFGAWPPV